MVGSWTDPQRAFNTAQRIELHNRAKGRCELCGVRIGKNFHADHVIPHFIGGPTETWNGQALCPSCNLHKSMNIDLRSVIPHRMPPRDWQEEFVVSNQRGFVRHCMDQIQQEQGERKPYVLNAFPGTGKTFGCYLAVAYLLENKLIDKVVYCVPTDNLRRKSADTAMEVFGIELICATKPEHLLDLDDDYSRGCVVSYGMLKGKSAVPLKRLCKDYKTLVIADEMHHLEEKSGWGDHFQAAFQDAYLVLMTTGTPIRSDGSRIPLVDYIQDGRMQRIRTNYEFGYEQALVAGDVLPIDFQPYDGVVSWTVTPPNGDPPEEYEHELSEDLAVIYEDTRSKAEIEQLSSDRLRHCMDLPGTGSSDYIGKALADADKWLNGVRSRSDRNATGLVVCNNCSHADAIAEYIKETLDAEVAIIHGGKDNGSGESGNLTKEARRWLKRYQSKHPSPDLPRWIVSVGMLKEGVDVPQLAGLVYACNVTAPLSWIQIVGRVLRIPLTGDKSFMARAWMPRTPELEEMMQGMRDAVQEYRNRQERGGNQGETGNNGNLRRETEGNGGLIDMDGSISHDATGTTILNEADLNQLREFIPPDMSPAQAMSSIRHWGLTKKEAIENFTAAAMRVKE